MEDLKKLGELIRKAKGERTKSVYGIDKGISGSKMLKYILGDLKPTPEEIKMLADDAENGVTYEEMMEAAGYEINDNKINSMESLLIRLLQEQTTSIQQLMKFFLENIDNIKNAEILSPIEKDLIDKFRKIDEKSQEIILKQLYDYLKDKGNN